MHAFVAVTGTLPRSNLANRACEIAAAYGWGHRYEDNISGKLPEERFIKLSRDYELEQTNLTNLVEHLRQEVKEQEKQKVNVNQFIASVKKYIEMQQLDASILREFVEKIYIS